MIIFNYFLIYIRFAELANCSIFYSIKRKFEEASNCYFKNKYDYYYFLLLNDCEKKKDDEAVIESYANMTFWLTMNPSGFFEKELPDWFPNWINLAMGISVTHSNPKKSEFLIGLDYNLKRIKTKSIFLNHLIHILDRYHLPAPAIRLAPGFIGYGLYF